MLSKLPVQMVAAKLETGASIVGNKLILSYSDNTVQEIDFGPWIEARLKDVKATLARWDQWLGGANLQITYPESCVAGTAFNWSISGGWPNADFVIVGVDGLALASAKLDATGSYAGSSTATAAGNHLAVFKFAGGGEVIKNISVAPAPGAPIIYSPSVTYPVSGVQSKQFTWSIVGGKPNSQVTVIGKSGLSVTLNLDDAGVCIHASTPLFYGTDSVSFEFFDGVKIVKDITIFAEQGTVLGEYCSDFSYYRSIADGNGGQTEVLLQANDAVRCGYVNHVDVSGIPTLLFSAVPGGNSMCVLDFTPDGAWHTYEFLSPQGPGATYIHREGRWLSAGEDAGAYEIFATLKSLTVGGVRGGTGVDYTGFMGSWINMKTGLDDDRPAIEYFVDQGFSTNGGEYYTYKTTIESINIKIRKASNKAIVADFDVNMNAANACFSVDTFVKTPKGDRLIATLKVGEEVSAFSAPTLLDSNVLGWEAWTAPVEETPLNVNEVATVVKSQRFTEDRSIKINGFHSTLYHTYLVANGGNYMWKRASDITTDDSFITIDRQLMPITQIELIEEPSDFVFLNVEDLDTLIVRASTTYILAHNAS